MNDAVKAQMQGLVNDAKGHKAAIEMAKVDYRHTMKKLDLMAELYPELAKELGVVIVEKSGDKKKND